MEKKKENDSDSDGDDSSLTMSISSDDDSDYNNESRKKPQITMSCGTPRYVGDFKEEDLQCPTKMKKIWDIANKQIKQQRTKLRTVTQKNKRLEGQVVRLKNIIRHLKTIHK